MSGYIIIMATDVHRSKDLGNLSKALQSFPHVKEWSIDMTDCDKVLRISASNDISTALISNLQAAGLSCNVMGIFDAPC